jgi:hypothetical protein
MWNDELFESDEKVIATARHGDDRIIYVLCDPSALSDGREMEAIPTFDKNTVIVAVNWEVFDHGEETSEKIKEVMPDVLAKGTMLAEEVFALRSMN